MSMHIAAHLMLQDVNTGKHPTMVGPVLVHQQTDFSSFNYFISTLISTASIFANYNANNNNDTVSPR